MLNQYQDKIQCPNCTEIAQFIPPTVRDVKNNLKVTYQCPNGHKTVKILESK